MPISTIVFVIKLEIADTIQDTKILLRLSFVKNRKQRRRHSSAKLLRKRDSKLIHRIEKDTLSSYGFQISVYNITQEKPFVSTFV